MARRTLVAAALVATLAHATVAHAAPALHTNTAALQKPQQRDYDSGRRAYEAGDYVKAAQTWNALLGRIPEAPASRTQRAELVVDVMAAYQAAFEQSGDAARLRTGMDAYYAYFKAYRDAHGSTNIPTSVVEARTVMKQALSRAEGKGGSTPSGGTTPSGGGAPVGGGGSVAISGGTSDTGPQTGTPLIATGAVLVALGAGASALIAVGAINGARARSDQKQAGLTDQQRDNVDHQGRTANALLIAGAVLTPVLVITGVSLIAKGAVDKRKARLAVAPAVTPRFAGLVVSGRF